jgi:hypothetical protein
VDPTLGLMSLCGLVSWVPILITLQVASDDLANVVINNLLNSSGGGLNGGDPWFQASMSAYLFALDFNGCELVYGCYVVYGCDEYCDV